MNPRTEKSVDSDRREPFGSLRRRNERRSRIAKLLEAERERRIERVVQAKRKQRLHQAR